MDLIFGYLGAILIGFVLGLLGGGGSILTVPILVYVLGINPILSTAYSLFVVGASALVGSFQNFRKGLINFRVGFIFAIPALIAVYSTRKYLIPAIPQDMTIFNIAFTKDTAVLIFFAFIMLLAAISMIRKKKVTSTKEEDKQLNYPLIFIEGIVVGVITGLVGAGGGFLIIPALVILANQPMKIAVATSLMIIAIKSLIGFLGDVSNLTIDWTFLLSFTGLSIIGIFLGIYANKFISGKKLKTAFGYFVLIMSIYIFGKEMFL